MKYFFVGLVVVVVLLGAAFQLSRSRDFQVFGELISRVETTDKVIALTFDDGPVPGFTDKIIAALAAEQVHATFFLMGQNIEWHTQEVNKLIAAGHQVGNHSYSHPRMVLMSYQAVVDEVSKTNQLIRSLGYDKEILFRPPYGKKLLALPFYLWREGITTVTWDVEPESFPEIASSSEKITQHVIDNALPGSIILLHVMYESRQASLDAVPGIIRGLKAQGYQFVTLDELLAKSRI